MQQRDRGKNNGQHNGQDLDHLFFTLIQPPVERQSEAQAADQREDNEPVPFISADGIAREVNGEDDQQHRGFDDKGERQVVVGKIVDRAVFIDQPVDKNSVRHEQAEKGDEQQDHQVLRIFQFDENLSS